MIGNTLTWLRKLATQQPVKSKADVHSPSNKVWENFHKQAICIKVQVEIDSQIYVWDKKFISSRQAFESKLPRPLASSRLITTTLF